MSKAFIVCANQKSIDFLADVLHSCGFDHVESAADVGTLQKAVAEYDIILLNSASPDDGLALNAVTLAHKTTASILFFVKSENADELSEMLTPHAVYVIPKPVNKQFLIQIIRLIHVNEARLADMRAENKNLKQEVKDLRIIDRAKCLLIQYLNMTEKQAHRYIEKQSMDMRQSKRSIAENIIRTYEM